MGESTMNEGPRSWRPKLWRLVKTFGWLIPLVLIAQQVWWAPSRADAERARVIERFQQERKSRVIAMIHRKDTQSVCGLPAASILKVVALKKPAQVSDEMLVLADVAAKARLQVAAFVAEILLKHHPKDQAAALAITLSEGRWTHDFPITVQAARQLGIPVSVNMPPIIYELMDLYPQGRAGRPSVLYVPIRRERDARDFGGSEPPRAPEEK